MTRELIERPALGWNFRLLRNRRLAMSATQWAAYKQALRMEPFGFLLSSLFTAADPATLRALDRAKQGSGG